MPQGLQGGDYIVNHRPRTRMDEKKQRSEFVTNMINPSSFEDSIWRKARLLNFFNITYYDLCSHFFHKSKIHNKAKICWYTKLPMLVGRLDKIEKNDAM